MTEIVSSAVFQDTVGKILSGLVQKYEGGKKSIAIEDLERLEIAQIKLEAAIETTDKWLITDVSLLRWRNKLKRAAQECDDTLHKCKHRILEEKEVDLEVRNSSFPKRIAHATKSLFSSTFRHNDDKLSKYMVRRFEWFADGASEFLRFIELGGTPHCHMPFGSALARHLLTGKRLQSRINRGNACPLFLQWVPIVTAEHGIEANLIFMQNDGNAPENNFFFNIMLQISESVDIVGITIKCLQLFPPLFRSAVENIKKELMQLPTQDFSWVPYVDSSHHKEHWDNLHSFGTQWFRPNPLCCKQHDLHERHCRSKVNMSGISEASLEPVIEVNLQCQVSPPLYNRQRTSPSKGKISMQEQNPPFLKTGLLFMPHGSSQDLLPEDTSSVAEAINIDKQNVLHTNITLQQLEGIIVPKAIDYFCQNAEASVYQILWKSKHSTAYVQVENVCMEKRSTRRTTGRARKGNPFHRENREVKNRKHLVPHYLDLWAAHAPAQLQGSIAEWVQREKEKQMARPQLMSKILEHVTWSNWDNLA